jgi:peptidoglycan hydrolase-like protein with peptidoglycan-binding domain
VGTVGADVRRVQRLLHLRRDGVYGRRTAAAVRVFQRRHHLRPTGVVTARTWATLDRLAARAARR